jgi:ribbon-helix-helix protein
MKNDEVGTAKKALRRGTPFTIYFDEEQTQALNAVAKERHVSKATIVRLAVDELLRQIRSRQLLSPLGIQESSRQERRSGIERRIEP